MGIRLALPVMLIASTACCRSLSAPVHDADEVVVSFGPEARQTKRFDDPQEVLRLFLVFARAGDFEGVRSLLCADLRRRYDSETLAADYQSAQGTVSRGLEEIERALQEGGLTILEGESEAVLPLGGGRALRMVNESGGWRIASLH